MILLDWIKNKILNKKMLLSEDNKNNSENNKRNKFKVKTIKEMTNKELNTYIKKNSYNEKQLYEEILIRIGANNDFAKKIIENYRILDILKYHIRNGKLVDIKDGKVIFEDTYYQNNKKMSTLIRCKDGEIIIQSDQEHDYFRDCADGRPVTKLKISENEYEGITLKSEEIDKYRKKQYSKRVYDKNNLEVEKLISSDNNSLTFLTRSKENPFICKLNYLSSDYGAFEEIKYLIDMRYPDELYYTENIDDEQNININIAMLDARSLKDRNDKAFNYFCSLGYIQEPKNIENNEL